MTCGDPKTVLASGVFDLVHYGHVRFVEEAKKAGGKNARLIVVVARDSTVERLRGKRPVIPEDQRRAVIEALKPVDVAVLGYKNLSFEETFERTLEKIRPDIVAVGYDQSFVEKSVRKIIAEKGLRTKIFRVERFGPRDLDSSSKIKRKIVKEWK